MKSLYSILGIFLCVLCLSGCNNGFNRKEEEAWAEEATVTLSEAYPGRTFEVVKVEYLPEAIYNGVTNYHFRCKNDGVVFVVRARKELIETYLKEKNNQEVTTAIWKYIAENTKTPTYIYFRGGPLKTREKKEELEDVELDAFSRLERYSEDGEGMELVIRCYRILDKNEDVDWKKEAQQFWEIYNQYIKKYGNAKASMYGMSFTYLKSSSKIEYDRWNQIEIINENDIIKKISISKRKDDQPIDYTFKDIHKKYEEE